jgi:Holliday junction resolvase RusA-like endonuclease
MYHVQVSHSRVISQTLWSQNAEYRIRFKQKRRLQSVGGKNGTSTIHPIVRPCPHGRHPLRHQYDFGRQPNHPYTRHVNLFLVIHGTPIRKNERYQIVRPFTKGGGRGPATMRDSARFEEFCLLVEQAWRAQGMPRFREGLLHIEIASYWPRRSTFGTGFGDIDAPISATLDALQLCKAIENDVQIVKLNATKGYDKVNPRVEIYVEEQRNQA